MTDQGLQEAIKTLQGLAYTAAEIKSLRLGKIVRDLDIAVAIKRQRQRAGTWSL